MTVLQRQMAMSSLKSVFFSSQDVLVETRNSAGTLRVQKTSRKVRERAVTSSSSDLWWNSETNQLPRSLAGPIQMYFDKTATSLKIIVPFNHPAHAVWSNIEERKRRSLADHG